MITLKTAASQLGLSYQATFRRVSEVRPLIRHDIKRGGNGELLLNGSALAVLERLESLRKEGRSIREAVSMVTVEMGRNGNGKVENTDTLQARLEGIERENQILKNQLEDKQGEIERLWILVNDLKGQICLPRTRKRWLGWLRR